MFICGENYTRGVYYRRYPFDGSDVPGLRESNIRNRCRGGVRFPDDVTQHYRSLFRSFLGLHSSVDYLYHIGGNFNTVDRRAGLREEFKYDAEFK